MKKIHPSEREIWISGVNPVREALLAGNLPQASLCLPRRFEGQEIEELAAKRGIPVTRTTRDRIAEVAGHTHHQGVALKMSEFPYTELETLLENLLPSGTRFSSWTAYRTSKLGPFSEARVFWVQRGDNPKDRRRV